MEIKAITTKSPGSDCNWDTLKTHLKEVSIKTETGQARKARNGKPGQARINDMK